ncbi:MAG: GNAT family N-acetyltransferase [Flammeovirgaceae bacterium]
MIRPYIDTDKAALVTLLRLNIPKYFDPSEEADFIAYLDYEREDYFVIEEEHQILGSGGINYFVDERLARIAWDVIHPNAQGRGLGSQLLLHRIKHIQRNSGFEQIIVRTSQLAYPFYEKNGFTLVRVEKDFWAKGFDLYLMELKLTKGE